MALVLLTITSCKTQQPFQLSFGSGGGFTGQYTTYTLTNDGKLYKEQSATKTKEAIATLGKKDIKDVETLLAKANLPSTTINNPGNMSTFLNLTKDGKSYNNTWSSASSGNAALDELWQKLNSFIPKK